MTRTWVKIRRKLFKNYLKDNNIKEIKINVKKTGEYGFKPFSEAGAQIIDIERFESLYYGRNVNVYIQKESIRVSCGYFVFYIIDEQFDRLKLEAKTDYILDKL